MTEITCTCWCEGSEVIIPVEWVSEGRTGSCHRPGCAPGCIKTEHDEDEGDPQGTGPEHTRRVKMNRFKTDKYDPRAESSEGIPTVVRESYPHDLILVWAEGVCPCGCGEAPKGGSKAVFGMGHDIRTRGKLIRALASDARVVTVSAGDPTQVLRVWGPLEYARMFSTPKLDWVEAVRKGAARITEREVSKKGDKAVLAKAVGPQVGDRELLKVGRWSYDGRVVAVYSVDGGSELEYEFADKKGNIRRARKDAEGRIHEVKEVA